MPLHDLFHCFSRHASLLGCERCRSRAEFLANSWIAYQMLYCRRQFAGILYFEHGSLFAEFSGNGREILQVRS
jgi:hypothetical protein